MRHSKKINHLSRKSAHRKAMLSNMATSLILHKRITTTVAKAKALRTYVEPLITRSKDDTTHSRRMVFSYLQSKEAVNELFREVSQKIANRPGGYTRIIKMGNRIGDNAELCLIELVDYNELLLGAKEAKTETRKRSRRGSGKSKEVTETRSEKPAGETKPVPVAEPEPDVTESPVDENPSEEIQSSESKDENEKKAE